MNGYTQKLPREFYIDNSGQCAHFQKIILDFVKKTDPHTMTMNGGGQGPMVTIGYCSQNCDTKLFQLWVIN